MILVTGATGLVGGSVLQRLLEARHDVRAAVRSVLQAEHALRKTMAGNTALRKGKIQLVELDFLEFSEDAARKLCEGCSSVVHCAGLVHQPNASSDLYKVLNEDATAHLARAASMEQVQQFVFLSSSSVYGNRETNRVSEEEPCIADTSYASSKIASENLLMASPPSSSTVILRPSMVFGPGDRGNMLPLIKQVLSGKYFVVGAGDAEKSLIYCDDFALAVKKVIDAQEPGANIYNVANPEPVSMKILSESILKAGNIARKIPSIPGPIVRILATAASVLGDKSPLSNERLAKLTRSNSISVSRFCKRYDFDPKVPLVDALTQEINWAKANKLMVSSDPWEEMV